MAELQVKLFQHGRNLLHSSVQHFFSAQVCSTFTIIFHKISCLKEDWWLPFLQTSNDDNIVVFPCVSLGWCWLLEKWKLYHKNLWKWGKWENEDRFKIGGKQKNLCCFFLILLLMKSVLPFGISDHMQKVRHIDFGFYCCSMEYKSRHLYKYSW